MKKKQSKAKSAPTDLASAYTAVTDDNKESWSYEKALAYDQKLADEAGQEPEAPIKLPAASPPPGARKHLVEKWEKKHGE